MIKKLYIKFGGGCYTARVSNEGVKTFDYKILLCKFEFTMMQIIQILLWLARSKDLLLLRHAAKFQKNSKFIICSKVQKM